MARDEKKTRMRGLPPQLQLTIRDAATGSYPTIARTATADGRTGIYSASYNDRSTITFVTSSATPLSASMIAYWVPLENFDSSISSVVGDSTYAYLSEAEGNAFMNPTGSLPFVGRNYGNQFQSSPNAGVDTGATGSFQKPSGSAWEFKDLDGAYAYQSNGGIASDYFSLVSGVNDKPFSISHWLYAPENGYSQQLGLCTFKNSDGNVEWKYELDNRKPAVYLYTNPLNYLGRRVSSLTVSSDQWVHCAVTYDGSATSSGFRFYLNGFHVADEDVGDGTYAGMSGSAGSLLVGSGSANGGFGIEAHFASELAIFNRALSADEVFQIANTDVPLHKLGKIEAGVGLPSDNLWLQSYEQVSSLELDDGGVSAGIGDSQAHFSPGQDLTPFVDSAQLAVDGKSNGNTFYATGSSVEGFEGPLWSKNKIEIDFTPLTASVLSGSSGHWMGYYNFQQRKWDARSSNPGNNSFGIGGSAYNANGIGFTPSLHPLFGGNTVPKSNGVKGKPFSNFGFPFDAKFQATSSQLLNLTQFIDRPFVLEKVVVEMSASYEKSSGTDLWNPAECFNYDSDALYGSSAVYDMCSSSYVVNNFFILNQRRGTAANENISVPDENNERTLHLRQTANPNGTIRDLVTWFEIASFNNDYGNVYSASLNPHIFYRDYTIVNTGSVDAFSASWNANIVMSASVRSPNYTPSAGVVNMGTFADIDVTIYKYPAVWLGSRSGLAGIRASGRDLKNPIGQFNGEIIGNLTVGGNPNSWHRDNPYILMPGDQLIFGWQIPAIDYEFPWNVNLTNVTASVAHFPVAPAKVTLYGSFVSEGSAVNDTTNQLLSSNSIHEALE